MRKFTKYPSSIMASVDLPFSKKAKQYAQAAWNKGMSVNMACDFVFNMMTRDGYYTDYEDTSTIQKAVDQVYAEEGDPNDPSTWVGACDKVTASEICYRDRDNDDRVVALDAGMSDEDVEEMLAAHPSYYRSTLDRFEACNNVEATTEPKYFANMVNASEITASKYSNAEIQKAQAFLDSQDPEKVEFVEDVYSDILDLFADSIPEDFFSKEKEIMRDARGIAAEDWGLSVTEADKLFDEIYKAVEIVNADEAASWC